ncbi:unnamed protein product [Lepeophtheirus salmonis]|uniref:(salmon louse) hypothetical protein n=1 Tax=Lepeophtheirus salmonis TaxID=72036 RepID=A0A7R8H4P7_LEPSM|nr:unnamed protein product [Lepeophtheirus salmonis]CAF2864669.1 unnamed protein product [Lepeophtheirus salmonis]
MGSVQQHLRLQWNDYESNFKKGFSDLLQNEELLDVTLICGSNQIKVHKIILSACSPVFHSIFGSLLISFMYEGEVNAIEEELDYFMTTAKELQVIGLRLNDPLSKNRWESQSSSLTFFNSFTPQSPLHLPNITDVRNIVNDSFSEYLPIERNVEDDNILYEKDHSNIAQNEYLQIDSNNGNQDISSDKKKGLYASK